MSARHVIDRGRVAELRDNGDGTCAICLRDGHGVLAVYDSSAVVVTAIARGGLLGADVEVSLSRAGETTPADGERARYLAASADVARLERELADAESARDRHALRARLLADGILDAAAGRPLDVRLDSIDADNLRALAAHLDAQRPHGPAADVERVVVGEGTVTTAFGRGRVWTPDPSAGGGHYWMLSGEAVALYAHNGRRARVVVELLPAAAVDAEDGVGDEAGEGVGQSVGVEHGASVATDDVAAVLDALDAAQRSAATERAQREDSR